MQRFKNKHRGFSLLELMIVIAIIAILGSISFGFYINYGKSVEINSMAQTISFDLKQARSRAMAGEGGFKWGIHFVNATFDYYEIFSTPTNYSNGSKVIVSTNYLSGGVTFSDPGDSSTSDIIFNKISGSTSPSSVSITVANITKTISVSALGNVSYQ